MNTFKAHLEGLEEAANNLLAYYRRANHGARTEPAPKHFDERWQMPTPALPVFGSLDMRKIEESVRRANEVLEEQIGTVRTEYEKAIRTFQRIDELSEEELARGSAQAIVKAA
jgi:hypothetical protein